MLLSLHIRDLALLDAAEIAFGPGLNVISGETGGGKSLVIAALQLLRGEKADARLVRHGAAELRVDGEFALHDGPRARAIPDVVRAELGFELSGDVVLVTRIVDAAGRSRARIDDRPATLTALRTLGAYLLEIHGQADARCLMRPELQAETLDAFAGCGALREQFARALADARAVQVRLTDALGAQRDQKGRAQLLEFQVEAMEQLGLEEGELERLEREHTLLANLDRQRELLDGALADLQDAEENAASLLGRAARRAHEAAAIDPDLADAAQQLDEAEVLLADAARRLQSGLARLDLDPDRLAEVDARLSEVRASVQRFGPDEARWFAALAQARLDLARLTDAAEQPDALAAELARATGVAFELAKKLVRARKKAIPTFCAAIQTELQSLRMAETRLRVDMVEAVSEAKLLETATAHGPSPVELMVRVNTGEPFHPLRDTASGGELARVVLAVKKSLADQDRVPFLVFDEIDAEIGGRLGLVVGRKLREVAAHHQVLIVTHLPQVAAFADVHLRVSKAVVDGRTHSTVARLDAAERAAELAAMSSWDGADATALAEARRLVARAQGAG